MQQQAKEKRYLVRCAASLVQSFFGLSSGRIMALPDASGQTAGGLFVIGSFVESTTLQLQHLLQHSDIEPVELSVPKLLNNASAAHLQELTRKLNNLLQAGRSLVLFTSRGLVAADEPDQSLAIGRTVADALVYLVEQLACRPAFFVVKGGITSSRIATDGLAIRRATVAGQVLPGVSVWLPDDSSRFPGMPYIIFPGNVGSPGDLTLIYKKLTYART
jgi:uncharacterized protein YgbK (DUF1537 family)